MCCIIHSNDYIERYNYTILSYKYNYIYSLYNKNVKICYNSFPFETNK